MQFSKFKRDRDLVAVSIHKTQGREGDVICPSPRIEAYSQKPTDQLKTHTTYAHARRN